MLRPRPWRRPMVARQHSEGHRQASWLELLFDLSFVVAVAQAAREFEHALAAGHPGSGLVSYLLVFAAIWWAWMAFTWFANVFDTDDVPYRLLMLVMIAGSLGLAAGVPQLAQLDFRIGVISYVVMRLAYVLQWLRVFRTGDPVWRPVALKIIVLTTINQAGWVLFLWVPLEWRVPVFVVWFAVDVATPILAGWDARMGGHRGHIVERYGLFTLIVLGESIAAATVAVGGAINTEVAAVPLLTLAVGGLILVFSLWWIYFDFSTGRAPDARPSAADRLGLRPLFLVCRSRRDRRRARARSGLDHGPGAHRAARARRRARRRRRRRRRAPHDRDDRGRSRAPLRFAPSAHEGRRRGRRDRRRARRAALTVPGAVLLTALVLAAAVAHAVLLEQRLHRHTPRKPLDKPNRPRSQRQSSPPTSRYRARSARHRS